MEHNSILLESGVFEKIKKYAEDSYPVEACGVLLTDNEKVTSGQIRITDACSIENTAESHRLRGYFSIDPMALFATEKKASENGFSVAGFYHSHPDNEAIPSAEDEKYMVPGQIYLITSVRKGIFIEIKGYIKDHPDAEICEVKIFCRFP
jgi:proteasome lid subunit RPN8/RPN11